MAHLKSDEMYVTDFVTYMEDQEIWTICIHVPSTCL
jgi:hypothetical protein